MDERKDSKLPEHLPSDDGQTAERGRRNREQMDETPPPGTDPLHEGP